MIVLDGITPANLLSFACSLAALALLSTMDKLRGKPVSILVSPFLNDFGTISQAYIWAVSGFRFRAAYPPFTRDDDLSADL